MVARKLMTLVHLAIRFSPRAEVAVLMQDVRQAARVWRRTPVLAAAMALTLALGLGANTAVVSIVYAVMFRPLPYPQPDRLVELFEYVRRTDSVMRVSPPNYVSWAERNRSFEALAAFNGSDFNLADDNNPERVAGIAITSSLFQVLAVAPVLGRPLTTHDEQLGAPRVALISESLWRRRFTEDPSVIGTSINLSGVRHEVVGVVPAAFRGIGRTQIATPAAPDIVVPLIINPAVDDRGNHILRVVGRLAPGVSLHASRDELGALAATMEQEYPESNAGWGILAERAEDSMFDAGVRASLWTLLGAAGLVFVIACANVSNLTLARASTRQRELSMRTVLGAERGRVVRQLLTESICVALASGIVGLVVAYAAIGTLRVWLPPTFPRIDEVGLDWAVLAFGLLISVASGIVIGVLPAVRATRDVALHVLMLPARGTVDASRAGVRQALLVAQVGLATMLLVAAALLLQSFMRLQNVPPGLDAAGVITARIGLPRMTPERAVAFYEQLLPAVRQLPQVESAAIGTSAPFAPGVRRGLTIRDYGSRPPAAGVSAVEHIVSADYFRALGIPMLAGASFSAFQSRPSPPVAIVSQSVARQLWGEKAAVGEQLERDGRPHQVIGVVGDVRGADGTGPRGGGLDRAPAPAVYLSSEQFPQNTMTLVVRPRGPDSALVPAIRTVLLAIDPAVPLYQIRTFDDLVGDANASSELTARLTATFAVFALLVAAVGVYAVVSYAVEQRTAEVGVRMAVGATPAAVVLLMVRSGMMWCLAGIAAGLIAASWLGEALTSVLFGIRADDPMTFMVVAAALAAVALAACYIPARHASRVNPLATLRSN
jgi:putative ABC transport system permease protein